MPKASAFIFFSYLWRIFCGEAAKNRAIRSNLLAAPKGFPLLSLAHPGSFSACSLLYTPKPLLGLVLAQPRNRKMLHFSIPL
jgi:hypothetical protein